LKKTLDETMHRSELEKLIIWGRRGNLLLQQHPPQESSSPPIKAEKHAFIQI
jgi:hypothetical protein